MRCHRCDKYVEKKANFYYNCYDCSYYFEFTSDQYRSFTIGKYYVDGDNAITIDDIGKYLILL